MFCERVFSDYLNREQHLVGHSVLKLAAKVPHWDLSICQPQCWQVHSDCSVACNIFDWRLDVVHNLQKPVSERMQKNKRLLPFLSSFCEQVGGLYLLVTAAIVMDPCIVWLHRSALSCPPRHVPRPPASARSTSLLEFSVHSEMSSALVLPSRLVGHSSKVSLLDVLVVTRNMKSYS